MFLNKLLTSHTQGSSYAGFGVEKGSAETCGVCKRTRGEEFYFFFLPFLPFLPFFSGGGSTGLSVKYCLTTGGSTSGS